METTTIRVDRDTKARLEELAADVPLARYLRELSRKMAGTSPLSVIEKRLDAIEDVLSQREAPTEEDSNLIVETRSLAEKLGYSKKRLETLDIFLAKAQPDTILGIYADLKYKLDHPEMTREDHKKKFIEDTASMVGASSEEVEALMNKLSQCSEADIKRLIQALRNNSEQK